MSTATSLSSQSSRTSHPFTRLPVELQTQIFEYAFAAEDTRAHRAEPHRFSATAPDLSLFFVHPRYAPLRIGFFSNDMGMGMKGNGVMSVCRLFRLFGLESWRRMIRAAPTSGIKTLNASEAKMKHFLMIMDALIEQMREKLAN